MSLHVEVKNLVFSYGSETVLDGVSLSLAQGDFIGIIGPNGSGKSTLLKNMAAVLTPDSGEIIIDGKALAHWKRRNLARRMGVVGQGGGAGFNFTVEEMVAMGRYPYLDRFGSFKPADRQAVERAMHLTGCYHLRQREIFSLSGGERQRAILARALAQETPCLLLDEPTSFLDLGYQVELLELLQSLNQREKLTIIVVMHDLNLASRYCRKLFLLYRGQIYAGGSPEEVLTREHILEVYRTEVLIEPHPLDEKPQVIPVAAAPAAGSENSFKKRVHLIGGGGSATPLMKELFVKGLSLSAGVLNVGDSDWVTARRLGLRMVEESPFSPISPLRHRQNLELIGDAGAVVLAPLYIGSGNLPNVEAALFALEQGMPLFVIDNPPAASRDFAGGGGVTLYRRLHSRGALFQNELDVDAIIRLLLPASSPFPQS